MLQRQNFVAKKKFLIKFCCLRIVENSQDNLFDLINLARILFRDSVETMFSRAIFFSDSSTKFRDHILTNI